MKGQGASMSLPSWAIFMKKCYADKTLNISREDFEKPEEVIINLDCTKKQTEGPEKDPLEEDTDF